MRLTILGATGRIGGHLLTWALDNGHDVRVLARDPGEMPAHSGLTATRGDALDSALKMGCACGALSTQGVGGTAGQPTLAQAKSLMRVHCGANNHGVETTRNQQ